MLTQELDVYRKAHPLTLQIYTATERFPKEELFGLVSQMRRAAVSINSNLMEGGARKTLGERQHFIGIARGSAAELEYQIILAKDLNFIDADIAADLLKQIRNIGQMLNGLIRKN